MSDLDQRLTEYQRGTILRDALRKIAGSDPDGFEGIHWVGDEKAPDECPGCIARDALIACGDDFIALTSATAPEALPESRSSMLGDAQSASSGGAA